MVSVRNTHLLVIHRVIYYSILQHTANGLNIKQLYKKKSIVIKSHCHHMHNLKGTARGAGLTARVLVRTIMDGSTAVMYLGVISATRRHWGCPRKSVQFHFLVISRYIIITLQPYYTPVRISPLYIYIYYFEVSCHLLTGKHIQVVNG